MESVKKNIFVLILWKYVLLDNAVRVCCEVFLFFLYKENDKQAENDSYNFTPEIQAY